MAGLHAVKVVLSATVVVPDAVFERHAAFCPHTVAEQLAEQLDAFVREESLGYYPALDFAEQRGAVDAKLLAALDQLAWLATSLVREEVRVRLRPLFASVQVQSMQAVAYSMPPVRPGQGSALRRLAEHLTPNRARFDLLLTLFRKRAEGGDVASYVEHVAYRHLSQAFDSIEFTNIKVLE